MNDVIILGKGPAGISSAIYTVRANLKTLVIAKGESILSKADKVENYYGFENPISGSELLKAGEKQALRLGVRIVEEDVVSIRQEDGYFTVETVDNSYKSKAVLAATGQVQKKLNIANLAKFEGKGISYCTSCDGFFYKNLTVGVLGYKDYAIHEALELQAFTKNIIIFTNGKELELSEKNQKHLDKFKLNKKSIEKIDGEDFLQKVYFEDGSSASIDGLFIAYESATITDFAKKMGIVTDGNNIVVDDSQQTNVKGLFAAGDCTGGFKQISVAVGEGALAGRSIIEHVRNN